MNLNDLFVSYKQVEPIKFTLDKLDLPTHLYINADRAKKVISEDTESSDEDDSEKDFSPELVESEPVVWKVRSDVVETPSDYKQRLRQFIIDAEGFRSEAYLDGKNYAIGYGFSGPQYKKGDTMTREEADKELDRQLTTRENKYRQRFGVKWDNLTDNQKIALMSYGYNTGDNNIINGDVAKYLDLGDMTNLRNSLKINTAGGKYNAGLDNRRKKERALFDS